MLSVADEIRKLKSLLDEGVLTQEEFNTQKAKLLNSEHDAKPNRQENQYYKIRLVGYGFDNKINTIRVIREVTGIGLKEAKELADSVPHDVVKGLTIEDCKTIEHRFSVVGATVEIVDDTESTTKNTILERTTLPLLPQEKNYNSQVRCPKCGSTSITTGARGVNATWGFIGAGKTVNRCAACGYTWKPR